MDILAQLSEPLVEDAGRSTASIIVLIASVLTMLMSGLLTGWLAVQKDRDAIGWFFVGLLAPVLGLLAVGLAPARELDEP